MGYDRGDSFPFDFEPNRILFGSKSRGKLSPRSYPIQFERKCKHSFFSVLFIGRQGIILFSCGMSEIFESSLFFWLIGNFEFVSVQFDFFVLVKSNKKSSK